MTSSYSTNLFPPSFCMKIVPYVPKVCKPEPKSKPTPKAKSMATTKTTGHSRSGINAKDGGDWSHIDDDFPALDPNASPSLDPGTPTLFGAADAFGSLDHDVFGGLGAASESELPEDYQSGGKSLDGGWTDHATSIAKRNSTLNGLYDGSSRGFPFTAGRDVAEEGNGVSDYQTNGYRAAAGNEGYRARQHSDRDAASMRALSEEYMEGIRHEPSPAEDEPVFNMKSRFPLTRKRTRRLSGNTVISAEVLDITSEPEPEDSRLAKRRKPSELQAESLVLDHVTTPKPAPLPAPLPIPTGPDCRSGASNEPSPGPFDNGSQGGGIGSSVPSQNNLEEENGNDGTHAWGIVEDLLHSPIQPSPFEEIEGDQYIDPDSNRREKNRKGSGGDVGECHDDEANQLDKVSRRPSAKTSQRRKRTVPPVQERCRGPSRTAPRRRDWSTMPTRASRQVTSSQLRLLSTPRMDIATRSCSSQTSSPGTKAGDGGNINYGSSLDMSYQITDRTLCAVPNGSSIVIEIIRCRDPKRSPNPAALGHKFLGGEGKVIRMTQLPPDSWMLLGYRYDDGASGPCTRGSLNADWMSNLHSDAASHETDHPDDDWDEEDENGEEDTGEYKPPAPSSDQGFNRDDMRFHQRTHKPWLKSDEQRLLSYKERMDMEWKDIFERFPDRTPGAIRTRWHMLRGN